jgi:peroxiredoxin
MALQMPTIDAELGKTAPGFTLPATDGKSVSLSNVAGTNGTVVVFICNHCPYVRAVVGRMVDAAKTLMDEGIGFVAISSNDAEAYPEDSFAKMKTFAEKNGFPFPYLYDESQEVARDYGAVCTPDFFGINKDGIIEYRGRLDEGRRDPPPPGANRELVDAMRMIARTGKGPAEQIPSVGCSMKWKEGGA